MSHAAVRLAPLFGAVMVMAACSPACAAPGARSEAASANTGSSTESGFVSMEVMGVLPTDEGHAVFLVSESEQVVLPIWIGGSEALAIQLRLERRRFERPLTHDLLDSIVQQMGGHVTHIQVDDLQGATFVGTVFVENGHDTYQVDARPSDAIALAVGNRVPILVARQVVDRAGLTKDDMDDAPLAPTPPVDGELTLPGDEPIAPGLDLDMEYEDEGMPVIVDGPLTHAI